MFFKIGVLKNFTIYVFKYRGCKEEFIEKLGAC